MGDIRSLPGDRPPFPSRAAYPCFREIVNDQGHGHAWFVLMPDGFLLDCGCRDGEARARAVAKIINEAGFEKVDREALRNPHD